MYFYLSIFFVIVIWWMTNYFHKEYYKGYDIARIKRNVEKNIDSCKFNTDYNVETQYLDWCDLYPKFYIRWLVKIYYKLCKYRFTKLKTHYNSPEWWHSILQFKIEDYHYIDMDEMYDAFTNEYCVMGQVVDYSEDFWNNYDNTTVKLVFLKKWLRTAKPKHYYRAELQIPPILIVDTYFKPIKPIEYIKLNFTIDKEGEIQNVT